MHYDEVEMMENVIEDDFMQQTERSAADNTALFSKYIEDAYRN